MIKGTITKHIGDAGSDIPTKFQYIGAGQVETIDTEVWVENVDALVIGRTSTTSLGLIVIPTLVDKNYKGLIKVHVFNPQPYSIRLEEG